MSNDVLILTIYFLVVIYVLYQMALAVENSLEDKLRIDLNKDGLTHQVDQQLAQLSISQEITAEIEELELKKIKLPPQLALRIKDPSHPELTDKITVNVGPLGKIPLAKPIKDLKINVKNSTRNTQIFIDWDRSSITTEKPFIGQQTQRVIRSGIPIGSDLFRSQVLSVINPGEFFDTGVTGENCLGIDPETRTLTAIRGSIFEPNDIASRLLKSLEGNGGNNIFPPTIAYSLQLLIGIRRIAEHDSKTIYLLLPFQFLAVLLHDEIAFPPLRWLLARPRPENARDALTTLLLGRPSKR